MLENIEDLLELVSRLYPDDRPKVFALLGGVLRVRAGEDALNVARSLRSTRHHLQSILASADPIKTIFGCSLDAAAVQDSLRRPREILGQLLLGELAERAFLKIYRDTVGTRQLILEDDRGARNETDYRVLNGERRPVFRINIKFHGTLFRNAQELVGLDPEDCFALATYKIFQGLQKQENERFPYLFAIVGVPGLTGSDVGAAIPETLTHLVALVHASRGIQGKRGIEERVVGHLLDVGQPEPFRTSLASYRTQIESAEWRVISARRADRLLREMLFERVYAVRVRAFARNYRNAELDMHFSLTGDLTPLREFLANLRDRGLHGLAVDLERGVV